MASVPPVCLSMVICEQFAFDPVNGTPSIFGVIHEIRCDRFPAHFSRLAIFAELTNGRGAIKVKFEALPTAAPGRQQNPVASVFTSVVFRDPLQVQITGAQMDNLVLLGPGAIILRMTIDDVVIMERRVQIVGRRFS